MSKFLFWECQIWTLEKKFKTSEDFDFSFIWGEGVNLEALPLYTHVQMFLKKKKKLHTKKDKVNVLQVELN